ncbi:MAG TPA: autotransporter outer membrane beta-barrel domain-containing protein [Pseudomonadales bacterium]
METPTIVHRLQKTGLQLATLLCLWLTSHAAHAALVTVDIGCSDPLSAESCSTSAPVTDPMLGFARDLMQASTDLASITDSRCTYNPDPLDPLSDTLTCNIGSLSEPVTMQCRYADGLPAEGSVNILANGVLCQLDNAESAFQMFCTGNSCTLATNNDAFAERLEQNVAGETRINRNILAVASSFLSCANGDTFGSTDNDTCRQLINALQTGDNALAAALIKALQPLNPETAGNMSSGQLRGTASAIQQRLTRLRSGNTMASNTETRLYLANNQWLEAGTRLAANDFSGNDAAPASASIDSSISEFGRLGLFVNVSAIHGNYNAGSIAGKSDSSAAIMTLGIDYRFSDSLVTGVALNVGQSKVEYTSDVSGEVEADNYSLAIYNSYYRNSWYLDTALTLGVDSYEQLRDPAIFNNSFKSEYDGQQYSLAATLGHEFAINAFNIAPFAQLTIGRMDIDAIEETETNSGGGGAAMAIDEQNQDIGSLQVGSHLRYVVNTRRGVFIPVLTVSAVNDFEDDVQVVTGRFIGFNSNSGNFSIKTEKPDTSYLVLAAGFSFQLKNGNAGFVNIETLEGYDNLDQQRLTLGWRWEL